MKEEQVKDMELAVFKWIQADDPFKEKKFIAEDVQPHTLVSASDVVADHGVPRKELQRYIQIELEESENFSSLPSTLLFVIAYACVVIVHDDAVVIRAVENSIDFDIEDNGNFAFDLPPSGMAHKDINDVNNPGDFWSWCRLGFGPLELAQSFGASENAPSGDPYDAQVEAFQRDYTDGERGIMLLYDRIVGGIRFQKQEAPVTDCRADKGLLSFYSRDCFGDYYELEPEKGLSFQRIQDPVNITWFFTWEDSEVHDQRMVEMELNQWLNRSTKKIEIAIPVYTGEFGLHTLVTVNFYFSSSGKVWKQFVTLSGYAEWYGRWYYAIYDALFTACLLSIFKTELTEVYGYIRNKGCASLVYEYAGFWNMVDWVSIISGLVVVLLAILSRQNTGKVNSEAIKLVGMSHDDRKAYARQAQIYVEALTDLVKYINILRLFMSGYPLVIVIRLFKAFKSQPRLALVTKTLSVTGVDLFHFMIVFWSLFIILTISGMVLFGRRVANFATFSRALNTLFRMMLGDFDWDELRVTGYLDGFAWLAITLCILNLLLLNMVLAIVMDGYTEVKKRSVSSDTLFQEIANIVTSWWKIKQGQWVPLEVVVKALEDIDDRYRQVELLRKVATETQYETMEARTLHASSGQTGILVLDEAEEEEAKPKILGRDSKAAIDMKVQPVNEDIRKFVGPGKIYLVSKNGSKARVLHEDGNLRDYDIGNDMNFELELAEGVEPVMFDQEDDPGMVSQAISPERLMKIVSGAQDSRGASMQKSQAVFLLEKTVRHYFKEHREDVDWVTMRQKVSKVEFRLSKIKGMIRDMQMGNHGFMTPTDEMRVLRSYLKEFYEAVHLDRQKTLTEIRSKEVEVRALRKKLLIVETQVLSDNFGENDRRTRQGLPPAAAPDRKKSTTEAERLVRASVNTIWPTRSSCADTHFDRLSDRSSSSTGSAWPAPDEDGELYVSHIKTNGRYSGSSDHVKSSVGEKNITEGDIDTAAAMIIPEEYAASHSPSRRHIDVGHIDVEFVEESEDTLDGVSSSGSYDGDEYELAALDNQLGINNAVAIAERTLNFGRVAWDRMTRRSIAVFNELSPYAGMQREITDEDDDSEDIDDLPDLESSEEETQAHDEWQIEDDMDNTSEI